MIGMSEDEFWQATPRYFAARQKAFSKRIHEQWEQSRYVAFYSMYATRNYKLRRFTDLGLFSWEKEEEIAWAPVDPAELEAFNALADSAHAYHTSLTQ